MINWDSLKQLFILSNSGNRKYFPRVKNYSADKCRIIKHGQDETGFPTAYVVLSADINPVYLGRE